VTGQSGHDRTLTHVHDGPRTPRLVAYWDGGTLTCALPESGVLGLGRAPSSDVFLDHSSVSRTHARLAVDRGTVSIEDLGSSNGTFVNGRRIPPNRPVALRPGDGVRAGSVTLVLGGIDEAPRQTHSGERTSDPVAVDPKTREAFELARAAGAGRISVLVLGETGVGKEVVAEVVHQTSSRSAGPFTRLNCAAIPENLFESTLFGHERGAFTGAGPGRPGAIEATDGGTLFLDEVGEIPLTSQAKLLRALESGETMRVGSFQPRRVDVRFVAATNRDLGELVGSGRFREDLLYRLNGLTIHVPPLRERRSDILPLAARFLFELSGLDESAIAEDTKRALIDYAWPGNVRELRNVLERALLVSRGGPLQVEHLPEALRSAPDAASAAPRSLRTDLGSIERQRIIEALEQCGGNQTQAAKLLGMPRRTLVSRIEAYGLPRPRRKDSG
jgi:transcriptional regulator with PAS, ATPase and Fis domain